MNDGRMSGGAVCCPIGQCHRVLPYKESGRWKGGGGGEQEGWMEEEDGGVGTLFGMEG